MEIPLELVRLYRHWDYHLMVPRQLANPLTLNTTLLEQVDRFIAERMRIWERKTAGAQSPWTDDPLLQRYRFCNIYRELDKQTIQIHTLLAELRDDFPRWLLNVLYLRLVARPQTVIHTGLLSFNNKNNQQVFDRLQKLPSPKYGTAYVFPISAIQRSAYPTREEFFCFALPRVLPAVAEVVSALRRASVVDALERILPVFGVGLRFHWTEVLIDVAYQYPELVDLFQRFPIGPGSLPTMRALLTSCNAPSVSSGSGLQATAAPEDVCLQLVHHRPADFPYLELKGMAVQLSAENWEGIGCEFRKYRRLNEGGGRHRVYRP